MPLSPAEKQRRYRERQTALALSRPDLIEAALIEEAEHCGQLSSERRAALANELADLANRYLRRAQVLAELARKVRPPGWNPPGAPP
jgi:hypothetical protein